MMGLGAPAVSWQILATFDRKQSEKTSTVSEALCRSRRSIFDYISRLALQAMNVSDQYAEYLNWKSDHSLSVWLSCQLAVPRSQWRIAAFLCLTLASQHSSSYHGTYWRRIARLHVWCMLDARPISITVRAFILPCQLKATNCSAAISLLFWQGYVIFW